MILAADSFVSIFILFVGFSARIAICQMKHVEMEGTYYQLTDHLVSHIVPPPPQCTDGLATENETAVSAEVKLWAPRMKLLPNNLQVHLTKVVTSCTTYFFGAVEKSIDLSERVPIDGATWTDEHQKIKDEFISNGIFPTHAPLAYDCAWTGTNKKENIILEFEHIGVSFSPDRKFTSPISEDFDPTNRSYPLGKGELWLHPKTAFSICDVELVGAYPGIYHEIGAWKRLDIPSQKGLFYIDESHAVKCSEDITLLKTRGGYLVSVEGLPHDPNKALNVSNARNKRSLNTSDIVVEGGNTIEKVDTILDRFYRNRRIWEESRIYIPTLLNPRVLKTKRSINPVLNPPDILMNYQLSLTRAELQWGLSKLKSMESKDLILLAKESCLQKLTDYNVAFSLLETHPMRMLSIVTGGYHPHGYYKLGKLYYYRHLIVTKIKIFNPLTCRNNWCKVAQPKGYWIQSHTGMLSSKSPPESDPPPESFVVEAAHGEWLDIVNMKAVAAEPAYPNILFSAKNPLLFSFNSSELMGKILLRRTAESEGLTIYNGTLVSHKITTKNISGKIMSWFNSIEWWVWDLLLYGVGILVVIIIFLMVVKNVLYCCLIKLPEYKQEKHRRISRTEEMKSMI